MNSKQKFENFLESLKKNGNKALIESVKKGFRACVESYEFNDEQVDDWDNYQSSHDDPGPDIEDKYDQLEDWEVKDMIENAESPYHADEVDQEYGIAVILDRFDYIAIPMFKKNPELFYKIISNKPHTLKAMDEDNYIRKSIVNNPEALNAIRFFIYTTFDIGDR